MNHQNSMSNQSLNQILINLKLNLSTNPRGTDKGYYKAYISNFYETEFSKRRNKKNRLLEIGVRSGASLALWANYFNDIEIIGLDIVDVGTSVGPVNEYINFPTINFYCCDAYDRKVANNFNEKFTILIDDGPHSLSSQIKFLELYLDKLDEGGVLIIEDILFGYRDCFQLMRKLPSGNRFTFEIYNFEKIKKDGGFLFVVRHNETKKAMLINTLHLFLCVCYELLGVLKRRIKRGDFSLKSRRKDI